MKTGNYMEVANKTEARGVHRTMFVILHRDFFSFVIFCNRKKKAPLPQDVLCFSGRVAVSPPPPQRAANLTAQTAGRIYRQDGRATGTLPGGAGRGGVDGVGLYTQGFAFTRHTPSFYEAAACWVFVFVFVFLFCKDHHIK